MGEGEGWVGGWDVTFSEATGYSGKVLQSSQESGHPVPLVEATPIFFPNPTYCPQR